MTDLFDNIEAAGDEVEPLVGKGFRPKKKGRRSVAVAKKAARFATQPVQNQAQAAQRFYSPNQPPHRSTDIFAASNAPQYVITFVTLSFAMRVFASIDLTEFFGNKNKTKAKVVLESIDASSVLAFIVLLTILLLMAKITVTDDLAVAFAFVIFISTLLTSGVNAFRNIGLLGNAKTKFASDPRRRLNINPAFVR